MSQLTIHLTNGVRRVDNVQSGTTLLRAMGESASHLQTPCGGSGRCGKCRVKAKGRLSVPSSQEQATLGDALEQGYRLACMTQLEGDAEVWILPDKKMEHIKATGKLPTFSWNPMFRTYGVAIDIGTTTLAARLYSNNGLLSQKTALNPQHIFGADVISRIEKSMSGEREAMAQCIRNGLSQLVEALADEASILPGDIDTIVITGNTTMLFLLTARKTNCLSCAPFEADELFGRFLTGEELCLSSVPHAQIYLPHCISAFVGADITTALLASGICDKRENALMADIGTNGELALWHDGELLCCSTAAGPVFEGAGISQGMQGSPGAIDHVRWENNAVLVHAIGDQTPLGICGSGIIDAIAALCQGGEIEESGMLTSEEDRVDLTQTVALTQKDIRMVQLAKGAICAGIHTLLDTADISVSELDRLAIAGGFGSYLDLHSAGNIGLYPPEFEQKAVVLGNASLTGAAMILLKVEFSEKASALAKMAHSVELSSNPVFMENYVECMTFSGALMT